MSHFCRHCGANRPPRAGEGTCPKCDPEGCKENARRNAVPYLEEHVIKKVWNKNYNQEAVCECGHLYYRHFDTYDDMHNVGCKYCECYEFVLSRFDREGSGLAI